MNPKRLSLYSTFYNNQSKRTTMQLKAVLSILLVTILASCGNKKTETESAPEAEPVVEAIEEKVEPRVFFKYPQDGATVGSPVFVEMGVEGMEIEPAGQVKEGFGHHHLLINQTSWPEGEVIPMSDSTLHYGKGQTDASVDLEP